MSAPRLALALLAPALLLAAPAARATNLGIVDGTVRDEAGAPVAGAQVRLLAGDGRQVDVHATDAAGHVAFEQVPFGRYSLVVVAAGGRVRQQDLQVESGAVVRVEIALARPSASDEEITVTAPRHLAPRPITTPESASTIERHQIEELPRGDTATVNDILATQPGFVSDAFGGLYARGNHANIQYQLDGVPLPDSVSGLFGGFLSSNLIDNMEVITGGLGAEYGDRLAAVVNLDSRRPPEAGEGSVELTYGDFRTVNPTGVYGRRIGDFSYLVGGSFKSTDRALDPPDFSPIVHDQGSEARAFVRLDYDASDSDHLSVLGNWARNRYQIPIDPTIPVCDPSKPDCGRTPDRYGNPPGAFVPADTNSTETERDSFALLSYRHDFGADASFRATGYYRHSDGILLGDAVHDLGPTQDPCTTSASGTVTCASTSDVTRVADHAGGTAEYLLRAGDDHVIKLGAQVDQLVGSDAFTSYTRSDALQGPDPALTVNGADHSHATTGGIYATDKAHLGKFTVDAGLRLDFFQVGFAGSPAPPAQWGLGPRLGVSYALTHDTVVHGFFGLMWMPPPVLDTPAAARILGVVPPGQAVPFDLRPERDRYAELGIQSRVLPELTLTLTAWGKLSSDQLDDIEVGNTNLVSPFNYAEGRAGGIEAGASAVLSRWLDAFANGTLSQAQGRGIASATYLFTPSQLALQGWQMLDHAQLWTANAGLTLHDRGSLLSALLNYGSGLRTGPQNNETVPGHVQVDLTLSHEFDAPTHPTVAVDVINLFDDHYAYRIANGFNGSHWAPPRSVYLRLGCSI